MKSYRPEELFDAAGSCGRNWPSWPRKGTRRMSANPHANGGLLLEDLRLPDFRDYAVDVPAPGAVKAEATRVQGQFIRDVMKLNAESQQLPHLQPGRDQFQPLDSRLRGHQPAVRPARSSPATTTSPTRAA